MTQAESRKIAAYLASLYDVPVWTEERLRAFAAAIADLSYGDTARAARQYVALYRERPQPADLRRLVTQAALAAPGPEHAWGELHECVQRCSNQPAFSHPLIATALRLTGRTWTDLRLLQYDQYPWLRRDFLAAYREASEQHQHRVQSGPALPDRSEARKLLTELAPLLCEQK